MDLVFNRPEISKEALIQKCQSEEDFDADKITAMIEEQVRLKGFISVREKNYVGFNKAPFDLTVGEERTLDLAGFEIKSDLDNYDRLPHQINEYQFICKAIYLVLHKKEAPDWLPDFIGVLRVTKENVYLEKYAYERDPFEISTTYEWNEIAGLNGLGQTKDRLHEIFKKLIGIRKNILFNRYFRSQGKFWPLTDDQIGLIVGFDVPHQLEGMDKDLKKLEKRLEMIRKAVNLGRNGS